MMGSTVLNAPSLRPHGEWGSFLPLPAPTERAGNTTPRGGLQAASAHKRREEADGEESGRVFDRRASRVRPPQVIMPTANPPAAKEVITAALLVIGGKICLSFTAQQSKALATRG
jgi:hypothetical protein